MKLIKAIVRPNKVDEVKEALGKLSISGMTVTEVRGHGKQKGHTAVYRGKEYNVSLLPKMEIEVVVSDGIVDETIRLRLQKRHYQYALADAGSALRRRPDDALLHYYVAEAHRQIASDPEGAAKEQAVHDMRSNAKLVAQLKRRGVSVSAAATAVTKGVVSACA